MSQATDAHLDSPEVFYYALWGMPDLPQFPRVGGRCVCLLLLLATGCVRPPPEAPATLLDHRFDHASKEWARLEGLKSSDGKLELQAIYYRRPFGGNFEAALELGQLSRNLTGMLLMKKRGGKPDFSNYVGIQVEADANGATSVRVVGKKDGRDVLADWNKWKANFEYRVGRQPVVRTVNGLRIVRDSKANCLHFYFRYSKEIDGQKKEGWMEFSSLPDWGPDSFFIVPTETPKQKGVTESGRQARFFVRALVLQTRETDQPDEDTGFTAVRRPYTFSGFTGDAVVVTFDDAFAFYDSAKFVFWSEANYIPWWHVDTSCAVSYGFCETWEGGTTGCCEPMSDRLLRWSKVDIVEANKARVVVHWEYVLADPEYRWWGLSSREKPHVDEWYCFYPDGIGVRKVTYTPSLSSSYKMNWNEISELQLVTPGGTKPSQVLEQYAISMLNLKGDQLDFLWDLSRKKPPVKMDPSAKSWEEAICRVNLRDRPTVFEVVAQGKSSAETFPFPYREWWANYGADWAFEMRGGYEFEGDFWTFSHWPISKMPYEDPVKTNGKYVREPSHVSLLPVAGAPEVSGPATWAFLIGMTRPKDGEELRERTASWLEPGAIVMLEEGSRFVKNEFSERALVFDQAKGSLRCHFKLEPSKKSARVANPVFKLRGWEGRAVSVSMDGKRLLEGRDYRGAVAGGRVVVWVNAVIDRPATFLIEEKR